MQTTRCCFILLNHLSTLSRMSHLPAPIMLSCPPLPLVYRLLDQVIQQLPRPAA